MRLLIDIVVAFVAYQFGRWVKESDFTVANFDDRNEIERLHAEIVELRTEIKKYKDAEQEVTFQ